MDEKGSIAIVQQTSGQTTKRKKRKRSKKNSNKTNLQNGNNEINNGALTSSSFKENSNERSVSRCPAPNINELENSVQSWTMQATRLPTPNKNFFRKSDSKKMYTKYRCSASDCGKEWWSSHGWTDYIQKCGKCANKGEVLLRSATPPDSERHHSSRGKSYLSGGGGHNSTLCEMCQDINVSCTRMNRVKVEEYQEGHLFYKKICLIRGLVGTANHNILPYYERYEHPPPDALNWIHNYISF